MTALSLQDAKSAHKNQSFISVRGKEIVKEETKNAVTVTVMETDKPVNDS